MNTTQSWHAVFTRPNCEGKVSRQLEKKGIVHYCPQNLVPLESGSQKKSGTIALFPSLVFIQVPDKVSMASLLKLPDVINLVYWQQNPAVFPASEIDLLRHFMEAHETVQLTKKSLHTAVLENVQQTGHYTFSADNTHTVTLPSIGYSLSAKAVPVTNIKLLRKNTASYRTTNSLAFILGLK